MKRRLPGYYFHNVPCSRREDRDHYSGQRSRESYDRDRWERREYNRNMERHERGERRDYREEREGRREYDRELDRRAEYQSMKEKARESYPDTKRSRKRSRSKDNDRSGGGDTFWDSKWEGMQLDEKLSKAEYKGRYYLNTKKRFQDATGEKGEGTPSLSPSPERKDKSEELKKKDSDSDSDTEEFKRLKKMKEVQSMKVDGDGFVQGPIADSSNFEYDPVTRMYKKKDGLVELETRRMDKDDEKEESVGKSSKAEVDKEELINELAKEIEELENEVDSHDDESKDTDKIDWGDSAITSIINEKEKQQRKEDKQKKLEEKRKLLEAERAKRKESQKLEDGEVSDGTEDGEVSSGDEKKKSKYVRRKKTRSRSRSRSKRRHSYSRSSRRRSRSYSRDRYYSKKSSRSPYGRERERYSRRRYSRSRSRSRSRGREREKEAEDRYSRMKRRQEKHQRSKINKEKLLDIAKKNAHKILKAGGDFMGMDQDRLISMKAGGSSLDELTKFCKELAKKGLEDGDRIELLAESESDSEEEFHHPFMVKDRPLPNPITMLIGEPKETLTPTARAVAKSQRMIEFPVSSGNAHRTKEGDKVGTSEAPDPLGEWEPVASSARPALMAPDDEEEMLKFHEQMEQEEKELRESASQTLWSLNEEDKDILERKGKQFFEPDTKIDLDEKTLAEIEQLKPKPSELSSVLSKASLPLALPAPAPGPPVQGEVSEPISSDPDKVFDSTPAPVVDIGTIVSRRLNAMRTLQSDPSNAEALAEMYEAQQMMTSWASSKNKPGQFVGSTGAKVLSKGELNLGMQCWAKAEQFSNAEKVKGGFGEFMLKKMGWKDGEGLGKFKSGEVNPLTLDIKFDKKGLMAAEETKRKGGVVTMTACKDLSGKHPVSALTELCSKRRWGPPIFTQAFECGPPHKKQYVFKESSQCRLSTENK